MVLDGRASDPVPVLFLIFTNDLPENIRSSVRLFADDCVLYRNIKSPLDCHIFQDDLNSLAKWETDWQMKFNVSKCHSMRVTRLHPSNHIRFSYTQEMEELDELEWPSLQSRRERSSLTFFYKIHSGTVSLDKDRYLTPAPNLR